MAKFLANENEPLQVVLALRAAGHDLQWIVETTSGADDPLVLSQALAEGRVLLTFDKGFGDLVFRSGRRASCGVILLRPKLRSPDFLAGFVGSIVAQPIDWENHFSVADEGHLRVVLLPD